MPDVLPPLALFEEARMRIAPHVVRTPMMRLRSGAAQAGPIPDAPVLDARLRSDLLLKLECLQASGSFKARGAVNKVLSLPRDVAKRGIVTASGGNHGLAVAYAGRVIDAETTVFLPGRATIAKASRIERWGARVVRVGDVWDDAHAAALEHAAREGLTYVHPFADLAVVAGAGTIALEILEAVPDTDLFIVAIGGGGLASGVASVAKQFNPRIRVVGVEPVGAPTLYESLRAKAVIELPAITTAATTLAPRRSDALNVDIIAEAVDEIVLLTDDEIRAGARFLLEEVGIGAELSGAAAVAAVLAGKIDTSNAKSPCALVCGAGSDALA
jgi:threonine dehydratase